MADDNSNFKPDFTDLPALVLGKIIGMLPLNDRMNLPLDHPKIYALLNSPQFWESLSLTLTDRVQMPREEILHTCYGARQLWLPTGAAAPPSFIPIPVLHEDSEGNVVNIAITVLREDSDNSVVYNSVVYACLACRRVGAHYGHMFIPITHEGTQPRLSDFSYPSCKLSSQERLVLTLYGQHPRELTLNIDSLILHGETKSALQEMTSKWDPRTLTLKFSKDAILKAGLPCPQHPPGLRDLLEVGLFSARNLERLIIDTSDATTLNFHETYSFSFFFEKKLLEFLGSAEANLPGLRTLEVRGCNSHTDTPVNEVLFTNAVARHNLLTHFHISAVNLSQGVLRELARSARAPLQMLTVEFTESQTYDDIQDLRESWSALMTSNPSLEVTWLFATSWMDRSVNNVLTETAPVVCVEFPRLPSVQMLLLTLIPCIPKLKKFTCTDGSLPKDGPDLALLIQFLRSCPNLDHLVYRGPVSDGVVEGLRSMPGRQWNVLDFSV